jgi:arylesterase / paraoxonase
VRRALGIAALVLVAVIGVVAYRIVTRSGMLRTIEPHQSGTCRTVGGVVGAEDVTIDPTTMTAYLSSDDRRARAARTPKRGEIYGLDLHRGDALPEPLTAGVPADFHPHGISLWHGPEGAKRLFVINHKQAGGNEVLVYDVGAGGLTLRETVTHEQLLSPNDLVATGPRQFYASNDRGYREGMMATLEAYLQLPLSSLSYYDGTGGSLAAEGLVLANGVNASADNTKVYVAECLGRSVRVYDRDATTGALRPRKVIPLDSCPDNIEVAEDGKLWVGAHPKVFDLLAHGKDKAKLSPSQVLRVDPETGEVEEVFLDSGAALSGTSTASVAGDRMVLGAIFEEKILVCDRPLP